MEAISNAKNLFLYIGGGAILSNCGYEIRDLAKKLNIPAVETLMAKRSYGG